MDDEQSEARERGKITNITYPHNVKFFAIIEQPAINTVMEVG